jgi:hypothetical protein
MDLGVSVVYIFVVRSEYVATTELSFLCYISLSVLHSIHIFRLQDEKSRIKACCMSIYDFEGP